MIHNAGKLVNRIHQTCQNFEQRIRLCGDDVDVCDKCLKDHDLFETSAKECNDYKVSRNPFDWPAIINEYE